MINRIARFSRSSLALLVLALPILGGARALFIAPPVPTRSIDASPAAAGVQRIRGVAITVSDLDDSVKWYCQVFNATLESTEDRTGDEFARLTGVFGATARLARLRLGDEHIELMEFLTPRGRPMPADSRGNDLWFQHIAVIVRDMDEAYAHLNRMGIEHASSSPQRLPDWNKNAAGIRAFYFRDPDGHFLEVLEFPAGKGSDRWQSDDRLFLGIDHTAIVVSDTEQSLRFFRDALGMKVAGGSENYGSEQEHLNAVFAARLRITTLRAPTGPAVELIEYLTPRDGRLNPLDARPTDLWHWHIIAEMPNPDSMFDRSRRAGGSPLSPGAQVVDGSPSFMARDPDGHAVLFVQPAAATSHN